MLAIEMTVEHLDGRTSTVRVLPVTQVAFERHFKTSFASAFSQTQSPLMEHVFWVAWHAARSGVDFDQWLETVAGLPTAVEEPVDPTSPAASAGQ